MTTMRNALHDAMGLDSDVTLQRMKASGLAIVDQDTMSRAIHDVFCGITADHSHPNEKDREQARQLMASISREDADPGDVA
jgi:hypothetical protein